MVVTLKWPTNEIEANASPLKPRVSMPSRSSKALNFEVACRSQSNGRSSSWSPILSLERMDYFLKAQMYICVPNHMYIHSYLMQYSVSHPVLQHDPRSRRSQNRMQNCGLAITQRFKKTWAVKQAGRRNLFQKMGAMLGTRLELIEYGSQTLLYRHCLNNLIHVWSMRRKSRMRRLMIGGSISSGRSIPSFLTWYMSVS